jgi:uncharacterized membrane protein
MIVLAGLAAGAVLFVLTYRLLLHRVPIKLMDGAEKRLLSIRTSGPNTFHHGRTPTHKSRQIVMPSPDLVYSSCVYDLSAGDLAIAGRLPPEGHYWSLSLYAHNTDNYFVLNDRELASRSFSIVVRREGRSGPLEDTMTIESPTQTGIALIRMIQRKQEDLPIIQASQQSIRCHVVKTSAAPYLPGEHGPGGEQ